MPWINLRHVVVFEAHAKYCDIVRVKFSKCESLATHFEMKRLFALSARIIRLFNTADNMITPMYESIRASA